MIITVKITFYVFFLLIFVPTYAISDSAVRQGHFARLLLGRLCRSTETAFADAHRDIIKAQIITFTLWLHLWDNFPLPSVVIGHCRLYHFIRLSGSQSGKPTLDPFGYGGMGSYVSTKIPL